MQLLWIHADDLAKTKLPGWQRWSKGLKAELKALGLAIAKVSISKFHALALEQSGALGNEPEAIQAVAQLAQGQPISGATSLLRDPNTVTVESALLGRTALKISKWTGSPEMRRRCRNELLTKLQSWSASRAATKDPSVILAHGMGSLIAYDTLLENPQMGGEIVLISFGSHLGHPSVRNVYAGRLQALKVKHWYNLHNPFDRVFTSMLSLVDPCFTEVRTPFQQDDGTLNHSPIILGREKDAYLDHAVVRDLVWPAILRGDEQKNSQKPRRRKSVAAGETVPQTTESTAQAVFQPTHRALLIGIDNYLQPAIPDLKGCVNDTYLISSVLQECGMKADQIRLLHNERATGSAIRERLHWLLDGVKDGDTRVLLFSGHGTQLESYSTGEVVDRQDECLVPHDYSFSRETGIVDDDLWRLYSQLPYGVRFISIMDCCHAGGTHRGPQRVRGIEPPGDVRHRGMQWNSRLQAWEERTVDDVAARLRNRLLPQREMAPETLAAYFGGNGFVRRLLRASVLRQTDDRAYDNLKTKLGHYGPYLPVLFQACSEAEFAAEYEHGPVSYGAFTYCLAQAMRNQGAEPTFKKLFSETTDRLKRLGFAQTPAMLGPSDVISHSQPPTPGHRSPPPGAKMQASEAGWNSSIPINIGANSFTAIPPVVQAAASLPQAMLHLTAQELKDKIPAPPSVSPSPGASTRKLFGQFVRHHVVKPELFPWNTIVQLIISFPGHQPEGGTGFYVSPRLIVTAGHCLHKWNEERTSSVAASSVKIIPSYGIAEPVPDGFQATDFRADQGWVELADIHCDFGLILVPQDVITPTDWLGPKILGDDDLMNLSFYVSGYAKDVQGLSAALGPLRQVTEALLPHVIDTVPGESGGPIFTEAHGGCFVGIHTAGTNTVNWGVRIRPKINAQIMAWAAAWDVPLN